MEFMSEHEKKKKEKPITSRTTVGPTRSYWIRDELGWRGRRGARGRACVRALFTLPFPRSKTAGRHTDRNGSRGRWWWVRGGPTNRHKQANKQTSDRANKRAGRFSCRLVMRWDWTALPAFSFPALSVSACAGIGSPAERAGHIFSLIATVASEPGGVRRR